MPIPWDKVLLHGPQVLDAAKTLYGKWQSRPKQTDGGPAQRDELEPGADKLLLRVKALEEAAEKQAALATELAEQNQAQSEGLTALKACSEEMQKQIEEAQNTHMLLSRRLEGLEAQLRETRNATSALGGKLTILLIVSAAALLASTIALLRTFL